MKQKHLGNNAKIKGKNVHTKKELIAIIDPGAVMMVAQYPREWHKNEVMNTFTTIYCFTMF